MNLLYLTAFWLLFTGLFAYGQGLLMPAIRRTPPGEDAKRQDIALHWLFGAVWLLPVALTLSWQTLVLALAVRFVAFDPVLNKAEGNHPFAVGSTARTDKLLRRLAVLTGVPVSVLSAGLRVSVFLLLLWFLWINGA